MKSVLALSFLLVMTIAAFAQTATGTFVATYPVTTTTTVNGTISCTLATTGLVLTCTFSSAVPPTATVTITLPSGL